MSNIEVYDMFLTKGGKEHFIEFLIGYETGIHLCFTKVWK